MIAPVKADRSARTPRIKPRSALRRHGRLCQSRRRRTSSRTRRQSRTRCTPCALLLWPPDADRTAEDIGRTRVNSLQSCRVPAPATTHCRAHSQGPLSARVVGLGSPDRDAVSRLRERATSARQRSTSLRPFETTRPFVPHCLGCTRAAYERRSDSASIKPAHSMIGRVGGGGREAREKSDPSRMLQPFDPKSGLLPHARSDENLHAPTLFDPSLPSLLEDDMIRLDPASAGRTRSICCCLVRR